MDEMTLVQPTELGMCPIRTNDVVCPEAATGILRVNTISVAFICDRHAVNLVSEATDKGFSGWEWDRVE